ncbi:MAG: prepilin-type N-terminal cleavage/methylation domain-containing protein [Proteobacteria bacterium]|nr:prepilin-type N-terminal cleavage/methylation domain-containing protein [Pseudomonadota bacterium]
MHVCQYEGPKTKDLSLKAEKGFTLIELSIVIVVIGLIVASIVGGQALINQSKLRVLVTDVNTYELATNTFKLIYNSLPGDFARANDYGFGASGNGDRQITDGNSPREALFYVVHLSNAGLYEGSYSCTPCVYFQIGVNKPRIRYSDNVTFYVVYTSLNTNVPTANHSGTYNGLYRDWYGNALEVGQATETDGSGRSWMGFLSVKDAQSIESKIDDGQPGTGRLVVTGSHGTTLCTNRTIMQSLPVAFNFTDNGQNCRLFFKIN